MAKRLVAVLEGTNDHVIDALPSFTREAEIRAETINEEARTVEVTWTTGARVLRSPWFGERYYEELSLAPSHVRMDRLTSGDAPVLAAHNGYSLDAVIGVIQSARLEKGRGVATMRFAKDDEDADRAWNKVQQRVLRNVSVGYQIHKVEKIEGGENKIPTVRAIDWEPYEVSVVPMGADAGAKIRSDQQAKTNPCVVMRAGGGTTMDEPTAVATTPAAPSVEPRGPSTHTDPGAPTAPATTPAERAVGQTERQSGAADERARSEGILRAVTSVGLAVQMATDFIARGVSLQDAQAAVIEEMSRRGQADVGPGVGATGIQIVRDQNSHVRAGIENALLHRVKPEWFPLDALGKLYANRRMIGLAECWLQSCGVRTTTMSTLDIAGLALGLNMRQGLHTTSDFANLLADVMGKTLRRAYDEAPQTFGPITSRKELTDFKPVKRTQISEAPALDLVNENGEFTSGTMGDAKEQYQLATYGKTFGITRQAMVNDDLDAFTSLAVKFGRSARQKESELVWVQITSNPNMGDGVALFHATHANLSATSDAIALASIGAAWAAMGLQKGLAGVEFLNLTPAYLIVPKAKETIANQFVSTNLLATQSSNVNPFAGKLTVIAEPRLDAASVVSWYLAAPIAQVDVIELGFLAGGDGPMVESQIGFKVDGIEVKCRHDVAAKVIDWRGLYKNPGA